MSSPKASKPPVPRWAWFFAAACFVIPVFTIGGAIPTAIGAFAGLGVMAIARNQGQPKRKKVIYCSVVTGSAWTVFLVFLFALTALQEKHPKLKPALNQKLEAKRSQNSPAEPKTALASYTNTQAASEPKVKELTREDRKKIYRMAVSMRYHIESAEEQRAKLKDKGFDVSRRDEQIERLEQREQDHFAFVMKFHKIDRNKLDEIIYEGDRNDWPTR